MRGRQRDCTSISVARASRLGLSSSESNQADPSGWPKADNPQTAYKGASVNMRSGQWHDRHTSSKQAPSSTYRQLFTHRRKETTYKQLPISLYWQAYRLVLVVNVSRMNHECDTMPFEKHGQPGRHVDLCSVLIFRSALV